MPQLDALRGFAVLAVLFFHFIPKYLDNSPLGWLGVRLFFVLSGFLITGILLEGRELVGSGSQGAGFTLRQFYARRFLRIFPIYYLVLLVLAVAGAEGVREKLGWHLAYLSNVRFVLDGYFAIWVGHFWSLSVEEQFYIVWPMLILFVPRRALIPLLVAAIAAGPIYRLASQWFAFSDLACEVLLPPSLDTLGTGALLAVLLRQGAGWASGRRIWALVGWTGFIVYAGLQALDYSGYGTTAGFALSTTAFAACAAGLIAHAAYGCTGWRRAILEFKPLLYVGTISYGLYVYHEIVSTALDRLAETKTLQLSSWAAIALKFLLSFLVAALSWHWYEKPINGLKRFFPMRASGESVVRTPVLEAPDGRPV